MSSKLWKGLIVVGVGAFIWFFPVPAGLKPEAWRLFAVFAATILGLILQPVPMGIVCFVSLTFAALAKVLTPARS